MFEHFFADRSPEEREAIKKKYATEEAIAGAPKRLEAICLDLLEHFTRFIRPGGFLPMGLLQRAAPTSAHSPYPTSGVFKKLATLQPPDV